MLRPCRLLLIVFVALLSRFATAQSRVDCNALDSRILKQPVHYCVMLPSDYDAAASAHPAKRYPIVYFLHGLGDNEQSLFKSGAWDQVEELRRQHKIGEFLIAAPQGDRTFYVNSADGKVRYSDFFLHEFMPFIEEHYPIRRERNFRAITGLSMGGYGALRFAFAHPELFGSVSAQSAALMAMRSGAPVGKLLGNVFGDPIDAAHWKENDPFSLAKLHKAEIRRVAIYFNCGRDDEYGFYSGADALDRQLRAEGIRHEFHLYPGNHSASYFLAHFGETMRFHSQIFETSK